MWGLVLIYLTTVRMIDECGLRGVQTKSDKVKLCVNFKKPSHADDSELTDDDLIIRYEKGDVVGITVLNASRRRREHGRGV